MYEPEIHEKVNTLHVTVFGVEGQGGMVRDLDDVMVQVAAHEHKLSTMSYKWLALVFLVGTLGNALGQKLATLLTYFKFFTP